MNLMTVEIFGDFCVEDLRVLSKQVTGPSVVVDSLRGDKTRCLVKCIVPDMLLPLIVLICGPRFYS